MASIIDTLMVVFKVDTRGLKSGIKEADIDLDRVKKSLKGVSEESEKVTQETDKSGKGIEKAGKSAKESQKYLKIVFITSSITIGFDKCAFIPASSDA